MKRTLYKGWIYTYINKINNKRYIGQTANLKRRKSEHLKLRDNRRSLIDRAIQKYGIDSFEFKILCCFCSTSSDERDDYLDELEILWINKLHSYVEDYPDLGYNLTKGGNGSRGRRNPNAKFSIFDYESKKECRKAYRDANKERKRQYDKVYNEKTKEKRKEKLLNETPEQRAERLRKKKEYRERNKEKIKEYMKNYRAENKDKIRETAKLYEQTHKEQISAYRKQYSKEWHTRKKLEKLNSIKNESIEIEISL